jgi:serine/threonine protein kinase
MGEVYRARDTRLDRTVAIKVLPEHLSSNAQLRDRFDREAKAISSLSHPHICPLYDVGHQDGVDFLVMEFLEGETLAHRLKKGPLAAEQGSVSLVEGRVDSFRWSRKQFLSSTARRRAQAIASTEVGVRSRYGCCL